MFQTFHFWVHVNNTHSFQPYWSVFIFIFNALMFINQSQWKNLNLFWRFQKCVNTLSRLEHIFMRVQISIRQTFLWIATFSQCSLAAKEQIHWSKRTMRKCHPQFVRQYIRICVIVLLRCGTSKSELGWKPTVYWICKCVQQIHDVHISDVTMKHSILRLHIGYWDYSYIFKTMKIVAISRSYL